MPRLARLPLRSFVLPLLFVAACASGPDGPHDAPVDGALVVSTWPFGRFANDIAYAALADGRSRLDAIELGIRDVERRSCDGSVGLGGRPNAAGYPQLDACIMDGDGQRAGSVAGVEGIVHPISAARAVLEHSKHVMLVGEGARWFALEHGVESDDDKLVEYERARKRWLLGKRPAEVDEGGHDTIALVMRDADGHIAGGCSTSGAGGKLPGRVGDSPILGSGLYVDENVGAAGATGIGENVMRYCGSFLIVEFMRQGMHPRLACEEAIHRIASMDPRGYQLDICFVAIDKHGRHGAASSNSEFPYAVTSAEGTAIETVAAVAPR